MTASHLTQLLFGQWLPRGGNVLLQCVVVLCITFGLLQLLRRASASVRHLTAVAGQAALLLLPLAALVLPERIPAPIQLPAAAATRRPAISLVPATAAPERDAYMGQGQPLIPPAFRRGAGASAFAAQSANGERAQPSATSSAGLVSRNVVARHLAGMAWCAWLAWVAGMVAMLAQIGMGVWRLRRVARNCRAASNASLLAKVSELRTQAGVTRRVKYVQPAPGSPFLPPVAMTWGAWHPVLLLPSDAAEWSAARLRAVGLHELAHVRRNDWLTQTLGQAVCALYWFCPPVWRLYRRAQMEAEHACDDAVLRGGMRPGEYAEHLLDAVRALQTGRAPLTGAVSMARISQVQPRVEAVLSAGSRRGEVRRPLLMATIGITGLVLFFASRVRPLAQAVTPPQPLPPVRAVPVAPARTRHYHPTSVQSAAAPGLPAYRHTFSCGLTLEVAAVAETNADGERWWRPDGGLLPDALKSSRSIEGLKNWSAADRARAILWRASAAPAQDYSFAEQITPDVLSSGISHSPLRLSLPASYPPMAMYRPFHSGARQCDIRCGVAAGPWKTIGVIRMPAHFQRADHATRVLQDDIMLELSSDSTLSYKDTAGQMYRLSFSRHGKLSDDFARQIVAVSDRNTIIPLESTANFRNASNQPVQYIGLNIHVRDWFNKVDLAHIREFRLQTRPYEWAEFRNVQLQPGSRDAARTVTR